MLGTAIFLAVSLTGRGVAQTALPAGATASVLHGTYYAVGDSISNDRYVDQQFPQVVAAAFPGLNLENLGAAGSSAA